MIKLGEREEGYTISGNFGGGAHVVVCGAGDFDWSELEI